MKKLLTVFLAAAMLLGLSAAVFAFSAVRSDQKLTVNGVPAYCDVYNIDGNNYFKLRDLACLLNDTQGQFAVEYDSGTKRILVTTGKAYTADGSELVIGKDLSETAVVSSQTLWIDGERRDGLSVFNLGGNNYFKLRDLGSALGFGVDYDEATRTMLVDTENTSEGNPFSVLFIDCGQGDAALVGCDGHYMLIDGGDSGNSQRIYSVLRDRGVTQLDVLVATHPHEDHVGGLPAAMSYASADRVYCSVTEAEGSRFSTFKRYADEKSGGITVPKAGDGWTLGRASVQILVLNAGESENDRSIVLKVTCGQVSFLFTGDAGAAAEAALLSGGAELHADVLKVAHHGSSSAGTAAFLNAVSPDYAVISVGRSNPYGHPAQETLDALHSRGTQIFRTDLNGDILFTSDGTRIFVSSAKSADAESLLHGQGSPEDGAAGQSGQNTGSYVVNTNSGIFHRPSCTSVKRMSEKNKWEFTGTRRELTDMGYEPCQNCRP